jgi:uncharacterized protein (TIGR03067 family)
MMKTKLMMLLILLPLAGAAPAPEPDVEEELKKFQGTWKLVAAQNYDGTESTPESRETTSLVVSGDEFVMTGGTEDFKGKFTIDPSKKPKTIDVEFTEGKLKGTKLKGIYEFNKDIRKSCFADANEKRPKDFDGGKGKLILEWKRDKP